MADTMECAVRLIDEHDEILPPRFWSPAVLAAAAAAGVPCSVDPGGFVVHIGSGGTVSFSPEPVGLQVAFEDVPRPLAEQIAERLRQTLLEQSGRDAEVVWFS